MVFRDLVCLDLLIGIVRLGVCGIMSESADCSFLAEAFDFEEMGPMDFDLLRNSENLSDISSFAENNLQICDQVNSFGGLLDINGFQMDTSGFWVSDSGFRVDNGVINTGVPFVSEGECSDVSFLSISRNNFYGDSGDVSATMPFISEGVYCNDINFPSTSGNNFYGNCGNVSAAMPFISEGGCSDMSFPSTLGNNIYVDCGKSERTSEYEKVLKVLENLRIGSSNFNQEELEVIFGSMSARQHFIALKYAVSFPLGKPLRVVDPLFENGRQCSAGDTFSKYEISELCRKVTDWLGEHYQSHVTFDWTKVDQMQEDEVQSVVSTPEDSLRNEEFIADDYPFSTVPECLSPCILLKNGVGFLANPGFISELDPSGEGHPLGLTPKDASMITEVWDGRKFITIFLHPTWAYFSKEKLDSAVRIFNLAFESKPINNIVYNIYNSFWTLKFMGKRAARMIFVSVKLINVL